MRLNVNKDDLQKDWLKINRMCKELRWLIYNDFYKPHKELQEALDKLAIVNKKIKRLIEDGN